MFDLVNDQSCVLSVDPEVQLSTASTQVSIPLGGQDVPPPGTDGALYPCAGMGQSMGESKAQHTLGGAAAAQATDKRGASSVLQKVTDFLFTCVTYLPGRSSLLLLFEYSLLLLNFVYFFLYVI